MVRKFGRKRAALGLSGRCILLGFGIRGCRVKGVSHLDFLQALAYAKIAGITFQDGLLATGCHQLYTLWRHQNVLPETYLTWPER